MRHPQEILEFHQELVSSKSLEIILQRSTAFAQDVLLVQSAAIYLFDKRGVLQRKYIQGLDAQGEYIDQDWFPSDELKPGQPFTGKVVNSPSGFGRAYVSNDLHQENLRTGHRIAYLQKLGELNCAMGVPLNGQNRTFGAIEVINKLDDSEDQVGFDDEALTLLMFIGTVIAAAMSFLRRRQELQRLSILSSIFINDTDNNIDQVRENAQKIAEEIVQEDSPYSACVIRLLQRANQLEVVALAPSDVLQMQERDNLPVAVTDTNRTVSAVYREKRVYIQEDVQNHLEAFANREWLERNRFVSFACFPIEAEDTVFGTLSVFTNYKHRFSGTDRAFLKTVLHLFGLYMAEREAGIKFRGLEFRIRQQSTSRARQAGVSSLSDSTTHSMKNSILKVQNVLEDASNSGRVIRKHFSQAIQELEEVRESLLEQLQPEYKSININHIINDVVKSFSQLSNIYFDRDLHPNLPSLYMAESDIADIVDNLITNAINAIIVTGRDWGTIKITTSIVERSSSNNTIQISVQDDGIGISSQVTLAELTQPGYTTMRDRDGTGTGLFVVNRLVRKYDGELRFESSVGDGTNFFVNFPIDFNASPT